MAKRTWIVQVDGTQHTVRLNHGYWSGKRQIWVDDVLTEEGREVFDHGSAHSFSIGNQKCVVIIATNGLTFTYALLVDDLPVSSVEDAEKPPPKFIRTHLNETLYWQDFPRLTGLKAYGRCFLGWIDHYLILVWRGIMTRPYKSYVGITVHYAPIPNLETFQVQIRQEPLIQEFLRADKVLSKNFQFGETSTTIALPYRPKKETPDELATRVVEFVRTLARYAPSLSNKICEGTLCKSTPRPPTKLVLINGYPQLLCETCIEDLSNLGARNQQEYKEIPSRLLPGIGVALLGAILGGIIWAVATVLLNAIASVFALVTFLLVLQFMDRLKTKRTFWSMVIAATFTAGSVVLGSYLTVLWYGLRESAFVLSINLLVTTWGRLFRNVEVFRPVWIISFLGIVFTSWAFLSMQKDSLKRYFKPEIEIVEKFDVTSS